MKTMKRNPIMSYPAPRELDEWEVRNAADTVLRASEINMDKGLMSAVTKELNKRKKAIEKATKK